jgi:flagellum-specific peptidoglycan hydrolase FlgJ
MAQPTAEAIAAARASAKKRGIPASVTLAQWALESAWGTRMSGKHNCFGIKAKPGEPCTRVTTHETIKGKSVATACLFRDYASLAEAFDAHAQLLGTGAAYADFRKALPDLVKATEALGGGTPARPRYATDPNYGSKLMAVIRGSKLTQYDA